MRIVAFALASLFVASDILMAQEVELPVDMILEEEASDVEVCQDFI